jgi:type IV secretion system protein VirB10
MISNTVGGAVSRLTSGTEKKKTVPADPNSAFAQTIAESSAESIQATQVKDLDRTLAQGKLIQGVLETTIDSTVPAPIRAIVSHDTYAESGKAILIPKGSRLIGVYNSSVKRGQARIFIIWTRVIRPDGVDVALNSPGIDALGRGGAGGFVDNKYFEAFSTAIFTSSLDVGFAALGDSLFGSQQQTTTTGPGGGTSVTSSPTATAMQQAISNLGSVGQSIVNSTVNLEPTIHIDQGELINVFVNKDVMFPTGGMNNAGFIP